MEIVVTTSSLRVVKTGPFDVTEESLKGTEDRTGKIN